MHALALTEPGFGDRRMAMEETASRSFAPDVTAQRDDELMRLAREGSTRAFNELVCHYERRVRAFCSCLLKDDEQARDAAQETFLKLWGARNTYRPRGRFREMLLSIARNECRSRRRRNWVRGVLGLRIEPDEMTTASAEVAALETERDALVRRALRGLPEKFAVPLTLRFVEGLDYASIAAVIGRTESATRSRIHYGLKMLNDVLPAGFP